MSDENLPFFTVSGFKLVVMFIMTLGLYAVYWFYKNWKLQQPFMDKNIWPVWRAIFSIFFTHALFKRIEQKANIMGITYKINYNVMATLFVSLMVVGNLFGALSEQNAIDIFGILSLAILIISVYPLYKVQITINQINNDPHGVFNNEFNLINYVLIFIGAFVWFSLSIAIIMHMIGIEIS